MAIGGDLRHGGLSLVALVLIRSFPPVVAL
jgi:hypothetical protein